MTNRLVSKAALAAVLGIVLGLGPACVEAHAASLKAQDKSKPAAGAQAKTSEAKPAPAKQDTQANPLKPENEVKKLVNGDDNEKGLIFSLEKRQKEIEAKEHDLKAKEDRLTALKNDVNQRLDELNKEHDRIAELVKKVEAVNDDRTKKIIRIYESMAPEDVASRVEKMDESMAVMILMSLPEKRSAKILSFINVDKAVRLTQSLKVKAD